MILSIIIGSVAYLLMGLICIGIVAKIRGKTIEDLKEDRDDIYVPLLMWPFIVIAVIMIVIFLVVRTIGLWLLEHIFKVPHKEEPIVLAPPTLGFGGPQESDPPIKIHENLTPQFDFMDME